LEKNDVRFREFRRFDVRFSIRDSVSIPFLVPETIARAQVSQHRTDRTARIRQGAEGEAHLILPQTSQPPPISKTPATAKTPT